MFMRRMEIIAEIVGNPTVLVRKADISRRTISLYLSGASDPSRERLVRLAEVAGVNLEWLATGNGPMRGEQVSCRREVYLGSRQECEFVPVCDQGIHPAGKKFDHTSCILDYIPINPLMIAGCHSAESKSFFFRNRDVAMAPTIQPEDLVLVHTGSFRAGSSRIYVLFSQGLLQLRRIIPLVGRGLLLAADNPLVGPQTLAESELEQLDIVGPVIWVGKKL